MGQHTEAVTRRSCSADQGEGIVGRRSRHWEAVDLRSDSVAVKCVCTHNIRPNIIRNLTDNEIASRLLTVDGRGGWQARYQTNK